MIPGIRTFLCTVAVLSLSVCAHADTVTTFSLTHAGQTIQFSVTGTTPVSYFNDGTSNDEESFTWLHLPLTIDGQTSTSISEGVENLYKLGTGAQLFIEYVSATVNGVPHYSDIFEQGNPIYTKVNGKPVFTSGTFYFPQVVDYDYSGSGPSFKATSTLSYPNDKLVVTQGSLSAAPVPEPSSFALLGTGLLSGVETLRRRTSRTPR